MSAFLRLGRKYDIDVLRVEALRRVFYDVPTTLNEFDSRYESNDKRMIIRSGSLWLDIVNLAREHDLQSVIPLALYLCCCLLDRPGGNILKGLRREDGTDALLSTGDQLACYSSHRQLLRLQGTTAYAWLSAEGIQQSCQSPRVCSSTRKLHVLHEFFPLACLQGLEKWSDFGAMCAHCVQVAQQGHSEGRKAFWDKLPEVFGLPGWDTLKKERVECVACISCCPYILISMLSSGSCSRKIHYQLVHRISSSNAWCYPLNYDPFLLLMVPFGPNSRPSVGRVRRSYVRHRSSLWGRIPVMPVSPK